MSTSREQFRKWKLGFNSDNDSKPNAYDAWQSQQARIDELERTLCMIGVVGVIDGHDVIRRDSVIEIVRSRKANK